VSKVKVLFVCLGNICRSPTAHGVFESLVQQQGLFELITVDSAGTGDWHLGHEPDARSAAVAKQRGYDLSHLRARQVSRKDFAAFDYVLAMDEANLSDLQAMCPEDYQGELALFLDFHPDESIREVPDPYYGGEQGFDHVFDLVEIASEQLLQQIMTKYQLQAQS
jgi:protein-tyrosine phosphatase